MKAHTFYKYLKRWREKIDATDRQLELDLAQIGEIIHAVMSSEGLRETFATHLDTGVTWADAGRTTIPSARDSGEIQARGVVNWESKHWGDDGSRIHFSLSGSLGFVSTMMMVKTNKSGDPVKSGPQTLFQQAFAWDFTPRFSIPVGDSEIGLFGRWGQSRLTADSESFERGEDTIVAERIANDTGRNEYFIESGAEFKLYNRHLDIVHHQKEFLNPVFSAAVGYRKDNRLRNWGNAFDGIAVGPDRMFYRFTVNLNRIVNLTDKSIINKEVISFRFSVDHDRPIRGSRIPPSTRLVFGGDLDLLKALRGDTGN